MATFTDARKLAQHQRNRARKVKRSILIAQAETVEEIKQEAIRLVSGGVSSATLKGMGQPFGRRAAKKGKLGGMRGSLPRLPINIQSGQLRSSMRVFKRTSASSTSFQLQFTSPHAVVLTPGGTSRMVARGFWAALNKYAQPRLARRLLAAKRSAEG